MRPTVLVFSSKGDNFKIEEVDKIQCDDDQLKIDSFDRNKQTFDRILRDRSIELVNIEVEDIGF